MNNWIKCLVNDFKLLASLMFYKRKGTELFVIVWV